MASGDFAKPRYVKWVGSQDFKYENGKESSSSVEDASHKARLEGSSEPAAAQEDCVALKRMRWGGGALQGSDGSKGVEGLRRPYGRSLVVGNYCHDIIQLPGGVNAEVLGGSVSYIGNVLDSVGLESHVVSKVGPDFAYEGSVYAHPPKVIGSERTTQFFADLRSGEERVLRAGNICEQIFPSDIPMDCNKFEIGLVVGVAGEIRADTLQQVAAASQCVVVDVQALIRTIDPETGVVGLRRLEDTPFYDLLDSVSYLKAASSEAGYIDLEQVRKKTCVIVTEGRWGSRVYGDKYEYVVPPFAAEEVDPTGAGDSFLAGFCAGLLKGMSVEKAVLMGNYFGALAVGQVGVPHFTALQLEGWGCNTLLAMSNAAYECGLRKRTCMILDNNPFLGINDGFNQCLEAGCVCSQ